MRRALTILLLLTIAGAAGWTLYRWKAPGTQRSDPWRSVPARSAVILEIPDALSTWDAFTHTSQLWGAFEQVPGIASASDLLAKVVAQLETDRAFEQSVAGVPLLVALMRDGGEHLGCLLVFAPDHMSSEGVATIAGILGADVSALNNGQVVEVRPDTALPALSVRIVNGVWTIASSAGVLEEADLQRAQPSITADSVLARAMNTLGAGAEAHLLVHTERAFGTLGTWWTPDVMKDLSTPNGWVALDVRSRPDALIMSGLLVPMQDDPALATLAEQGVGPLGVTRVLPAEVSWLYAEHVADPMRYLSTSGVPEEEQTHANALFGWVRGTVATARTSDPEGARGGVWALFGTDDPESARQALDGLCTSPCDTLSYRSHRMSELPLTHAYERLLGPSFAAFERPWWTVLGTTVVMAQDVNALRISIDVYNDGNTLAEDERTLSWLARISAEAGRMHWCDVARCTALIQQGMRADAASAFAHHTDLWSQLGGVSVQLSPGQHGMHHVTIGAQFAPLEDRGTRLLWAAEIGPLSGRKPDILRNHTNNTREVLVQDAAHRIHLVSSTGKVLWSRAMDGPILGDVHQVDRFRNGKLQVMFNTAGQLHQIDRNGKDVDGFPVTLRSQATAPMAVFDYDAQRDYRIILPTADGRIMNFGIDGMVVKGWEAAPLAVPAVNAVRHVRIKNKDFLLVVGGSGKVLLLDRRGVEREKAGLVLPDTTVIADITPGNDILSTRVIWSDSTAALFSGALNGTIDRLASPGSGVVLPGDRNADGSLDVLRITADSLIMTRAGRPVFSRSFGAALLPRADRYAMNGGAMIGVVVPDRAQVLLVDGMGHALKNMPLEGVSPFSIADLNLDGTLELITTRANGSLVAYQLP
ncbi:MAG: hypothetical protein KDB84_04470 [Flavobacteriales bacterium]|nr:hypothetical protein [Flavobacteriales bacterium]